MKTKKRTDIIHGNISDAPVKKIGDLRMRVITAAPPMDFTFLHEALPSGGVAPYVVHSRTTEFVFMVKGAIWGLLDGQKIKLVTGDYLFIPAGVEHKFEAGVSGGEAISIFSPPMDPDKPDAKIVFRRKNTAVSRKI